MGCDVPRTVNTTKFIQLNLLKALHYPVKNTYDYCAIATVDSPHSGDDPHQFSAMFLYIKKPLLPSRHFQGFFSFSLLSSITTLLFLLFPASAPPATLAAELLVVLTIILKNR